MKIVLLNPPFLPGYSRAERSPQVAKSGTLYFPVWLAYATGVLEAASHEVLLVDAVAEGLARPEVIRRVQRFAPRLVVVDTSTASFHADAQTAAELRAALPGAYIVMVGPHVTATAESSLDKAPAVDAVVRGEYDYVLRDLAAALAAGDAPARVRGLTYRGPDGALVSNEPAPLISDLDELPLLSGVYERHLDIRRYYFAAALHPGVMLIFGRGCPNGCAWCLFNQTLHSRRHRFPSTERVIAEFAYVCEHFPEAREIWIEDDTFTVNKKRIREICEALIDRRLRLKSGPLRWYCNARVNTLDYETMRLMKRAGCRLLVVGFESGDQRLLDNMHKGIKLEDTYRFMADARRAGLLVHGCFMVGNIGETRETMRATLAHAKRLLPDSAQFYFVHPYPGTAYYRWALANGALRDEDYRRWLGPDGTHECVIELPGLSADEMRAFCEHAYYEYHFSPRYLAAKVRQLVFDPLEGLRSLRSGLNYVGHLLRSGR